eukprot:CAMPEP_0172759844 /NCGR_PEP_ID=MMETSP1074-20121228/168518_1 /TAXON_ID=2916 /ORGANISM="Ceratium fusus, Strain PA161109" /LENGTH=95 /DNA_ID=CAMNT_0013593737 /DNA_START=269 /DNA_END=556 /DNA_ORIENTATION=+
MIVPPERSHTRQGISWLSCICNTLAMSNLPCCTLASRVSELMAPGEETKKLAFFCFFGRRGAVETLSGEAITAATVATSKAEADAIPRVVSTFTA